MDVHPNPFNSVGKITISSDIYCVADMKIFDISGHIVTEPISNVRISNGETEIPISLDLLSGLYHVMLQGDNSTTATTSFILLK
ncbi:T9SS type A sorting domain-containing protein [bacterium]|nr:T9SS type A sorting domain-containing protein [bacterium]